MGVGCVILTFILVSVIDIKPHPVRAMANRTPLPFYLSFLFEVPLLIHKRNTLAISIKPLLHASSVFGIFLDTRPCIALTPRAHLHPDVTDPSSWERSAQGRACANWSIRVHVRIARDPS
jgi:hypothetical protein